MSRAERLALEVDQVARGVGGGAGVGEGRAGADDAEHAPAGGDDGGPLVALGAGVEDLTLRRGRGLVEAGDGQVRRAGLSG